MLKKVKNPANIFKYFKHCSNELKANGGGQFVNFLWLHIGKIQIWIHFSHFFSLLYRFIRIPLVVHCTLSVLITVLHTYHK